MSNRIPDLPILGEPLIPEFANTLYIDGPTRLDVLDHPAWINAWLRQAPCAGELAGPCRVRTEEAERLRVLRDALRGLLTCTNHEHPPDVEAINDAAGSTAGRRVLIVAADGELKVIESGRARGIDRLVSAIALRVINSVDCGQFSLGRSKSITDFHHVATRRLQRGDQQLRLIRAFGLEVIQQRHRRNRRHRLFD